MGVAGKKSPSQQEDKDCGLIFVEKGKQAVEKVEWCCGNPVKSVGKFWAKDKNCKNLGILARDVGECFPITRGVFLVLGSDR